MDPTVLLEEESLPQYSPDDFYPVTIGEVLDYSYKVLGKLGYGAHSTVWLCRHVREQTFVAVKVCTRDSHQSAGVHRELQFYERVSSIKTSHRGQSFIRGLLGTFEVTGPTGRHLCLVHPPMHMTIRDLQYMNASRRLNVSILRWTLSNVLSAAEVVHTDINPSNIMLTVADETVLHNVENAQIENMLPKKIVNNNRTIYSSHKPGLPRDALWSEPVLCDFGEARIGRHHKGLVQPELYRAPEVLFDMAWGPGIDIWSVAAMMWDLFENRHLFTAVDDTGQSSETHHVAEMVAYLGLPPPGYIDRSETTQRVFDVGGQWKGAGQTAIPPLSLDDTITVLDGEDKRLFSEFIKSTLVWLPEKRKTASELLQHPWLNAAS